MGGDSFTPPENDQDGLAFIEDDNKRDHFNLVASTTSIHLVTSSPAWLTCERGTTFSWNAMKTPLSEKKIALDVLEVGCWSGEWR
jgi:hypothetical protein